MFYSVAFTNVITFEAHFTYRIMFVLRGDSVLLKNYRFGSKVARGGFEGTAQ